MSVKKIDLADHVRRCQYTGHRVSLIGMTALGRFRINGDFIVQVDDLKHEWSHDWHVTNPADWDWIEDMRLEE